MSFSRPKIRWILDGPEGRPSTPEEDERHEFHMRLLRLHPGYRGPREKKG